MCPDHGEAVSECHDDRGLHAGQLGWEDHMFGNVDDASVEVVVPVDPEQVERVGGVMVDVGEATPDPIGDA